MPRATSSSWRTTSGPTSRTASQPQRDEQPPFTPNLDHLGATGLWFTEAWANPVCSPTRSALLTGDYAFRTEIGEPLPLAPELKRSAETLPELFGIHSGLFGKWHLGLKGSLPADWSVVGNPAGSPSPTYMGGFNEFVGYLDGEPGQYLQWNKVEYVSGGGGWTVATEQLYVDDYNASAAYLWLWDQTVPPPTSSWLAVLTLAAPHTGRSRWAGDTRTKTSTTTCAPRSTAPRRIPPMRA